MGQINLTRLVVFTVIILWSALGAVTCSLNNQPQLPNVQWKEVEVPDHWHGHYTIPIWHMTFGHHIAFYADFPFQKGQFLVYHAIKATDKSFPDEPGYLKCPVCDLPLTIEDMWIDARFATSTGSSRIDRRSTLHQQPADQPR